VTDFML